MGFLSGVLSNIKDHLGQHKNEIDIAINILNDNKHLGKNGFNDAIVKVVAGVGRYNEKVKRSNDQVKQIVTDLQSKVSDAFLKGVNNVLTERDSRNQPIDHTAKQVEQAVIEINAKLEECKQNAQTFIDNLDTERSELKTSINDLNDKVKQKLDNVRSTVMHESGRLQAVKEKEAEELNKTIEKIGEVMSTLKVSVDCNISEQVKSLVDDLLKWVQKILDELRKVDQKLKLYVKNLADWINAANDAVDVAVNKVDEILKKVDLNDGAEYPRQMQAEIEQILVHVNVLFGTAGAAGEKVTQLVTAAKEKVNKLEQGLMEDLYSMRELIKSKVTAVQDEIGKLHHVIEQGGEGIGKKTIAEVIKHIQKQIGGIKGDDEDGSGLSRLPKNVQVYAEKFTKETFQRDVLNGWIQEILKGQGAVDAYLTAYVGGGNSVHFKKGGQGALKARVLPKVEKVIQETVKPIISNVKSDSSIDSANVSKNFKHMKEFLVSFANELTKSIKFQSSDLHVIVGNIKEAINADSDLVEPTYQTDHQQSELYDAVEGILNQLVGRATGAANNIEKLLSDGNFGNLDKAISVANELDKYLKKSLGKNSDDDDDSEHLNYADNADKAIQGVSDELTTQLPDDQYGDNTRGDPRVSLAKFTYSFGQPNARVSSRKSKKELLDDAIKKIQDDVTDTLQGANHPHAEIISHASALTRYLNYLCTAVRDVAKAENPEGLKKKLLELKDFINNDDATINGKNQKSLNKIHIDLNKLQRDLESGLIKTASRFLGHATAAGRLTIEALKKHAGEQVKIAQDTLITHARKHYVNLLKFALEKFAAKTTTELQPLPNAISDDLEHGHKKFMNMFAGTLIDEVKKIDAIDTTSATKERYPLGKAADICKDAVKGFLTILQKHADFTSDVDKVSPSTNALRTLFSRLHHAKHFNNEFKENLESLANELRGLNPKAYGEGKNPWLFESLKKGLSLLVEEFGKTYISTYSQQTIDWEQATADEKLRYAKVLFTMTPFIYHELTELKDRLEIKDDKWNPYGIYNSSDPQSSLHVRYFRENGYDPNLPDDATHGALNHRETLKGSTILRYLTADKYQLFKQTPTALSLSGDDGGLTVELEEENGVIRRLYDCLHTYSRICHLIIHPKTRPPCSVYEILVWCNGLQFNPVYERLKAQVKSEFMKEDKQRPGTKTLQPFDAHPSRFEYTHICEDLYNVSCDSHAVLTAILGHGHKDGIYACEFSSNSLKLDYPTSMIQLLCTLFDLLKRLYHQLYFLLQQCQLTTQRSGWRNCHYGRYIGGSGWQCNTKHCPKQDCDQRHDQSGNQTGGEYPNCGVKSPLQSFLEDGLKGHLPHSVAARGSSLSCGTCGSTPGMPCRTPMGFADISEIASHTMIGRDICEVLEAYCGSAKSPLTRLCSYLNCLLPSAPKTLADMFSFYYHLTYRWGMHGNDHKSNAFDATVKAANFGRDYGKLKVYYLFSASHSALKKGHSDGSLGSLVCLSRDAVVCGPYLRPITHAIYETFSSKHADKYLSWVVYLTASFYDLLKKLYDECNSKCGSRGSNCHEKACVKECPTTSKQDPPRYHHRNCKSIVSCNSTMPTLAKYGFVLGDPERLSGSAGIEKKRTCRDLCTVFAEAFEKDSHLVQFFKAIDKFMFTIRQPFIWLNVALWSLSLFYLICVMVGRLDVLHIRSHVRIPSSHKITAQSLLAAAQVGRLAKISYLQP